MSTPVLIGPMPPVTRRIRAYFAPVNRTLGQPAIFDAAANGQFNLAAPPAPWIDLGWIENFSRKSTSTFGAVNAGSPATAQVQVREQLSATVSFHFLTWQKLTMALSTGSQHMNLLFEASAATPNGSGGAAATAAVVTAGSTSTFVALAAIDAARFTAGQMVAVDADYAAQIGYVGAGVSGAYVRSAALVGSSPDYLRRITFNVARVSQSSASGLTLAQPLIAGAPAPSMKVQAIAGFVDREGGTFFQEWSALFVMPGEQGDRILYYYPRLQSIANAEEAPAQLSASLERLALSGSFRALPVTDANDGETVLCFRSYLPSPMTLL
ncbi:MAG TPA: hypothetical protein VGD64_02360 [Acidisarcina sp.]